MLKRYCVRSLPEWVLCLATGVALSGNVLEGFVLPAHLYEAWLPLVLFSMGLLAVLYAVSYSKKTALVGVPLLLAVAGGCVLICGQLDIPLLETEIAENNTGLWWVVVCITVVIVFCLTRSFCGTAALCLLGTLASGWICLSQYPFSVPCLIVFLVGAFSLLAVSKYRAGMLRYSTRKSGWMAMAGISLAASVTAVALACALWFGVLAAWNLPTLDVTLLTKIVSLEVLERIGVSKTEILLDEDTESSDMDEDFEALTDEIEEETQEELEEQQEKTDGADQQNPEVFTPQGIANAQENSVYGLLSDHSILALLLTIFVLILVGGLVALFLLRHRLWLWWLQKKYPDHDGQVDILYHWLIRRLPRLGLPAVGSDTPLEYARRIQTHTALLDENGLTWLKLSQCFCRLCYGGSAVTEEEYQGFLQYYYNFCKQKGKLRRLGRKK